MNIDIIYKYNHQVLDIVTKNIRLDSQEIVLFDIESIVYHNLHNLMLVICSNRVNDTLVRKQIGTTYLTDLL